MVVELEEFYRVIENYLEILVAVAVTEGVLVVGLGYELAW